MKRTAGGTRRRAMRSKPTVTDPAARVGYVARMVMDMPKDKQQYTLDMIEAVATVMAKRGGR